MQNIEEKTLKFSFKSILKISFSNILSLLSSLLVGFILPKLVDINDYGYYKTFTLYISYIGIFHLGIISGIYLKYSGTKYEEINKDKFRYYTKVIFGIEFLISFFFFIISFLILKNELRFIFCFVSIYIFLTNINTYYQTISQITFRFNELSLRTSIYSALQVATIVILMLLEMSGFPVNYRKFIILNCTSYVILIAWYMYTYKEITFGIFKKNIVDKSDILELIKMGAPLLISNLCVNILLVIDRQFVNILFNNVEYAIYSFAYNMLSIITVLTSAIALVVFPSLKNIEKNNLKSHYSNFVKYILILVLCLIMVYYPLHIFVEWFLPEYKGSLIIFRIILPGLAISSTISIVMHNYYKLLGQNMRFFLISLVILGLSIILNFISYYLFKNMIAISIATIITMLVWYILSEIYFIKIFKIKWKKNFAYMIFVFIIYYFTFIIDNIIVGFFIFVAFYLILTIVFFKKDILILLKKITERK